jgi:S1-C subfamily serine protease
MRLFATLAACVLPLAAHAQAKERAGAREVRAAAFLLVLAALGACAGAGMQPQHPEPAPRAQESLLPGSIGVVVRGDAAGPVVIAVRAGIRAVREGDVVLSYNGIPVSSGREFNRLVADTRPGSVAELELRRAGATHRVRLPVRQLELTPRG